LDLTEPIQDFTDRVYQQAHKVGIIEPILEAKYVKRAKLKDYLPLNILKLEPKKVIATFIIIYCLFIVLPLCYDKIESRLGYYTDSS
jgi:hypothetical protein